MSAHVDPLIAKMNGRVPKIDEPHGPGRRTVSVLLNRPRLLLLT